LKRLLKAALLACVLAVLFSGAFIGLRCFSSDSREQTVAVASERVAAGLGGYRRPEVATFLTFPEWYIVFNTEEYAQFLGARNPSAFPYFGSIRQYWRYYGGACDATQGVYPFSGGNHLMLAVIGTSFTAEYLLKGLYENTVGRVAEWIGGRQTAEDAFAHRTAVEYGRFMHSTPWYAFPFFSRLRGLWNEPATGPGMVRKWERRLALSGEYAVKGVYGWLIGLASGAAYAPEDLRVHAWIDNAGPEVFTGGDIKRVKQLGPRAFVVTIPRYGAFTEQAQKLIASGVRFMDIAGNDEIFVTALVPAGFAAADAGGQLLLDDRTLTDPTVRRIGVKVPVTALHETVRRLQERGARIEHIYDY
jgi:hypothetical protein